MKKRVKSTEHFNVYMWTTMTMDVKLCLKNIFILWEAQYIQLDGPSNKFTLSQWMSPTVRKEFCVFTFCMTGDCNGQDK
jgi:hypothetical protein